MKTIKKSILLVATLFMVGSVFGQKPEFNRKGIVIAKKDSMKLSFGAHSVGRFQYINQKNVKVWKSDKWVTPPEVIEGMQTSFANLEFAFTIGNDNDIEVFLDLLVATQRHSSKTWGNNGYMYIKRIPGNSFLTALNPVLKYIDIKAGNFYADFGEHLYTRTLNGDAHRNPLVGNPVVSPLGTEPGMEIIHKGENYGLMVGAGIGAPEQDFGGGRNYSFRSKVWATVFKQLYFSGSYYTVNHDHISRGTNLFRRERLGTSYGAIWNLNNDNSGSGEGPGQVRPGSGKELTAWELNAIWTPLANTKISGYIGQGKSVGPDPNHFSQSGDEEWMYYTGQILQYLKEDSFYLSARYSNIDYSKFLANDNTGNVNRFQLGFGSFITKNILLKGEYVYQKASGFNAGTTGVVTSVDVGNQPKFSGVVLEVAVSF